MGSVVFHFSLRGGGHLNGVLLARLRLSIDSTPFLITMA